jgi:hypothetical protein
LIYLDGLHDGDTSDESDEEETYTVGLLDDPDMVPGRHRNGMSGDRVTGPIISLSTIHNLLLKALISTSRSSESDLMAGSHRNLNETISMLESVVDGIYILMDPGASWC